MEDSAQIRKAATAVRRADILINSAGFTRMVPHADLEALDDDLIDAMLRVHVRGPLAMIRAFAPLLRATGSGVVINISSGAAQHGTGSSIIYGAAKAAVNTMSMALARVLGARAPLRVPAWLARPMIGELGLVMMTQARGADNCKARRELGWAPQWNFEAGLAATVDWYQKNTAWVEHIRSGEYRKYYQKQYGDLVA